MATSTKTSVAERCREIEDRIAACNAQLADLATQQPESERDFQKVKSSRDWAEHQRSGLISGRVAMQRELFLESVAETQAEYDALNATYSPLVREREEVEARSRALASQIESRRIELNDLQRQMREQRLQAGRYERSHADDIRERERMNAELRARLLSL